LANIASTSAVVGTGGGAVIGFAIMANCSLTIVASISSPRSIIPRATVEFDAIVIFVVVVEASCVFILVKVQYQSGFFFPLAAAVMFS